MNNPLLQEHRLPPFKAILPQHVEPAIQQLIKNNEAEIQQLTKQDEASWESVVAPLEELDDKLNNAWSPVRHMNSVVNSDELREVYNQCLPLISAYHTAINQNSALYLRYKAIKESNAFQQLSTAQQKVIDNSIRDFHLAGVDLSDEKKQRFTAIKKHLAKLGSKFSENVLDATQGWTKLITDKGQLTGLPETVMQSLQQAAKDKDQHGYLLTLEFPCYTPVMTYCDNGELRKEIYQAYTTRASGEGPNGGQWNNDEIMDEILALKHEQAGILGYKNYAELSLVKKMAETPQTVLDFLNELAEKSLPVAKNEFAELQSFVKEKYAIDNLQAWDISYYSEKLRQQKYDFSQEEVRPYFPANGVIAGMFEVVRKLYDIQITTIPNPETWHADVSFYQVQKNNEVIGEFYLDIYARNHKRGGAWMDDCRVRRRSNNDQLQTPVAYLTCNFTAPVEDKPSLLTHNEVTTLFHEFGHGLHHLLTKIDVADVSGINGVSWDAVELPSQFLENWCWQRQSLDLFAQHYETGEKIPEELFQKMLAAKNFQSGMHMVRQLEFALFDFEIHMQPQPQIQKTLDNVRQRVAVIPAPGFNRFQNSFNHIFSGGYAAGYYSYKWAEVLSADAFSRFEEEGIFNPQTGRAFLQEILEKGGSEDALQLFINFRGRKPSVDALLKHSGIVS